MIVKKIVNPKKSAGKEERIRKLTAYIRVPERTDRTEKCVYAGARGFLTDASHAQTAEMVALALDCVRSNDPVNHYVLSWPEGEQPSEAQIEEAVTHFLRELGLTEHQAIYGLHADTENWHLHIAVNRVHPDSGKCVEINRGFDLEAAHRAVAIIEQAQGWQATEHYARGEGDHSHKPCQRALDRENRTGEKSAQRVAMEEAAPIIKRATTWAELHRELGKLGMIYQNTGSGATISVGDIAVKASTASRDATLSKLQARLGAYEPAKESVQKREPQPVKPNMPSWKDYAATRQQYYAAKTRENTALKERHGRERSILFAQQKLRRLQDLGGDWRGRGANLNTLRSLLAVVQAQEKAVLRDRQRSEREQCRKEFKPYPAFKSWLKMYGQEELAEAWRYRRGNSPARIYGDRHMPSTLEAHDIRDFVARVVGSQVLYTRQGERTAGFVDHGKRIAIHRTSERDNVLAALTLGMQKWDVLTLSGDDKFLTLCVTLAAEHDVKIKNPELQQVIQTERERILEERNAEKMVEQVSQLLKDVQSAESDDRLRFAREQLAKVRRQFYDVHYIEALRGAEKEMAAPAAKRVERAQKNYDAVCQQEPQRNGLFNIGYDRRVRKWKQMEGAAGMALHNAKCEFGNARAEARKAAEQSASQAVNAILEKHYRPLSAFIAAQEKLKRQNLELQYYNRQNIERSHSLSR